MSSFDRDFPALTALPPAVAAAKLRAVGEYDVATAFEAPPALPPGPVHGFGITLPFGLNGTLDKPWLHSGSAIGYLPPGPASGDAIPIVSARRITGCPRRRALPSAEAAPAGRQVLGSPHVPRARGPALVFGRVPEVAVRGVRRTRHDRRATASSTWPASLSVRLWFGTGPATFRSLASRR